MAVAMFMNWAGITAQQYDEVRAVVGWEKSTPSGGLFHVAAFDEAGLHIFDLWDSAEQFQAFVDSRLMPGIAQVGLHGQPEVQLMPVHALFTPSFKRV